MNMISGMFLCMMVSYFVTARVDANPALTVIKGKHIHSTSVAQVINATLSPTIKPDKDLNTSLKHDALFPIPLLPKSNSSKFPGFVLPTKNNQTRPIKLFQTSSIDPAINIEDALKNLKRTKRDNRSNLPEVILLSNANKTQPIKKQKAIKKTVTPSKSTFEFMTIPSELSKLQEYTHKPNRTKFYGDVLPNKANKTRSIKTNKPKRTTFPGVALPNKHEIRPTKLFRASSVVPSINAEDALKGHKRNKRTERDTRSKLPGVTLPNQANKTQPTKKANDVNTTTVTPSKSTFEFITTPSEISKLIENLERSHRP